MKITQIEIEIDSTIERSKQWTHHFQAMQVMGAALRAQTDGRRLSDVLTAQQIELVTMGCQVDHYCVQTKARTHGAQAVAGTPKTPP